VKSIAMRIVRANPSDAAALTQIAFCAKRHWGYSEIQMGNWREPLTIRSEFIAANETYSAMFDSRVIGFYALISENGRSRLEHLWVLPEAMGKGVGRSLFIHAVGRAKELGVRSIEIESDPNAEGFYRRMGAKRVDIRVSEFGGQHRELPVLIYEIDGAH
jgi:ribosomal protein S18 acetylase RimI-like enzyme